MEFDSMRTATEQTRLRQDLQTLIQKILALREYSRTSKFLTFKSEHQLLAKLNPEDLAEVLLALKQNEGIDSNACHKR
jgi:hypothetical protein